jgi:putative membrane protein
MKRSGLLSLAIACVALLTAGAVQAAVSSADFVAKASEGNHFEIASSQIALQKSQNDNVKQFAQQMIDDHSHANTELEKALDASHADADMANGLDSSDQKIIDKLNKVEPGSDFDKQYVKAQLKAHKNAVKLFADYAKHGDDSALKSFAVATLPTLQAHLSHAKQLKSEL